MDSLRLAWRNVWRNPRRSGVTVGAIVIALFSMIVYSGLVAGYVGGMERSVLDLEIGDAQIFAEGYRKRPSIYTVIPDADALVERVEVAGFAAAPRLWASGLAAAGDASTGVLLRGIDVRRDGRVTRVGEAVAEGRWLEPGEARGVVVGRRVARTLGVGVGGEVVILAQGADGSMANEVYTVRGILKGISAEIDAATIFLDEAAFREVMVFPEGVHQVMIRAPHGMALEAVGSRLRALAPGAEASTWKELSPALASMLESSAGVMAVMMVVFYVALGIVVLNAMLMAVFERIREFGVLKALGVGPGGVFGLIVLETAIMSALAIAVAVVAALPVTHHLATVGIDMGRLGGVTVMGLAFDSVWRAEVDVSTFTRPVKALLVIIGLAVLYPALRAAFVRPIDAIRRS